MSSQNVKREPGESVQSTNNETSKSKKSSKRERSESPQYIKREPSSSPPYIKREPSSSPSYHNTETMEKSQILKREPSEPKETIKSEPSTAHAQFIKAEQSTESVQGTMQIYIVSVIGKRTPYRVTPERTVGEMIEWYRAIEYIPDTYSGTYPFPVRMYLGNVELQNQARLMDYDIKDGSFVHVIIGRFGS